MKDECRSFDLQRYPDGITAVDANAKCGSSGLENNPLVLSQIKKLHGQEFWTGLGIYTQMTSWIEMLGCFQLSMKPSTVHKVSSPGLCHRKCLTRYIGYNKENSRCLCFNNYEMQSSSDVNLSSCVQTSNDLLVLVYEKFNGTIKTSGEANEICTTLKCTFVKDVVMDGTQCDGRSNIQGLCEDGMPSAGTFWSLHKSQTFENCWKKDKLLLHSDACLTQDIRSSAWTNVFREEIEVERKLSDQTAIPEFCISATISDTGEHSLNVHRQKCTTELEWFVCQKNSTNHTDDEIESNYGFVVGGAVLAVIVLLIVVMVILCNIRRIGILKRNESANSSTIVFTKSVHDGNNILGLQTQEEFNKDCGLADQVTKKNNITNILYAQVQKVKSTEDNYAESSNGEYDHLHNIGERKPNSDENTYDSNAGVRSRNDPTYDTATSSNRVDTDNTYDHSFSNMKDCSEYDVSDPSMLIGRTNHDVYDQAC